MHEGVTFSLKGD